MFMDILKDHDWSPDVLTTSLVVLQDTIDTECR